MLLMILILMILIGVISAGIRLAWGIVKFLFGLGLFWCCPVLFLLSVLFGAFAHSWLLILIVAVLLGRGFARAA